MNGGEGWEVAGMMYVFRGKVNDAGSFLVTRRILRDMKVMGGGGGGVSLVVTF